MLGDFLQMPTLVVAHTGQDAELVQVFAVTDREPEDAHRKRHVLLIVVQGDDHIIQRLDHGLDMVVEIHTVDIHVVQRDGGAVVPHQLVIGHLARNRRGIHGKQTCTVLDVLVNDIAAESRTLHLVAATAGLDECAELIQEPHRIISHFAKAHYQGIEVGRHSAVAIDIHKTHRLQAHVLFQHLDADV